MNIKKFWYDLLAQLRNRREKRTHNKEFLKNITFTRAGTIYIDPSWYGRDPKFSKKLRKAAFARAQARKNGTEKELNKHISDSMYQ